MKILLSGAGAIALALTAPFASAQTAKTTVAPAGFAPIQAPCVVQADGACLPVSTNRPLPVGVQESVQLAAANTPTAAATMFGGDYILTQTCASYGTLVLQALGPDGATWQTLLTKTASDAAGGTGLALGSYATVRVTLTGTTGCSAILARVPA